MRRAVLAACAILAAAACGGSSPGAAATPTPQKITGTVNVFAATSLTAAFRAEGQAFEAKNPGVTVNFNFAGSPALAAQINQGAPADVFASADSANMQTVVTAGNTTTAPSTFARNKLEIVVGPGNPKGIASLADLAKPGLVVVLCAPAVPCGHYAGQALAAAGVSVTPKSQEQNVGGVVTKVESGDADAGIVYTTDVTAAGDKVAGVRISDLQNVIAAYPIAAIKGGSNPTGAKAFMRFVLSAQGQSILASFGFTAA